MDGKPRNKEKIERKGRKIERKDRKNMCIYISRTGRRLDGGENYKSMQRTRTTGARESARRGNHGCE